MLKMKILWRWILLLSAHALALPISLPAQTPQAEITNLDETTAPGASNKMTRRVTHRGGHEDVVLIGDDVVIKQGETKHDVVIIGGSATVDGTVSGDFVVVLGSVTMGPTAKAKRGLTVVGGNLQAHPDAEINGDRFVLGTGGNLPPWLRWPQDWFNKGLLLARPLPHQYVWSWVMAGLCLLTYLLISILFPQSIEAGVQVLEKRPGSAFLTGLLFVVLSLLLAFTVVLIPFLVCGIIAAFLFGRVILYRYAGQQL